MTYSYRSLDPSEAKTLKPQRLVVRRAGTLNDVRRLIQAQPYVDLNEDLFILLNDIASISAVQTGQDYKFVVD